MVKHRIARIAAFAIAVVGLQAPTTAIADSASADEPPGEHCVAGLATADSDLGGAESPVIDFRCFDTLAESLEYVNDGVELKSGEATATSLVGILYDETGYGSPTLALYGGGGSCSSGANYGFPNLGNFGWNNRPEAARGRNGCAITFYAGYRYTNDTKSCFNSCSNLGALNNRASSAYFW